MKSEEEDSKQRNNLLFYCLMVVGLMLGKKRTRLSELDVSALPESLFQQALDVVRPVYIECGGNDKAAKGTEMVAKLKARFSRKKRGTTTLQPNG